MDRDAGESDRRDEARQGDSGMIGSETEEPGPGRDTSLTDPDPVAAGADQPRATVAMSEGDPMRTRLGSQVEGAGVIGYDVAGAEERAAQQTPPSERPGYEPERTSDAGLGTAAAGAGLGGATAADDTGPTDPSAYVDEPAPGRDAPATYTGEEADVAGRPEYADRAEGGDRPLYQEEPQRLDRPGGGGPLFTDEEPDRLDRPGPQEPGVDQGVYDQEADQARRQRPSGP
jgi:hypothetical protein